MRDLGMLEDHCGCGQLGNEHGRAPMRFRGQTTQDLEVVVKS